MKFIHKYIIFAFFLLHNIFEFIFEVRSIRNSKNLYFNNKLIPFLILINSFCFCFGFFWSMFVRWDEEKKICVSTHLKINNLLINVNQLICLSWSLLIYNSFFDLFMYSQHSFINIMFVSIIFVISLNLECIRKSAAISI